MTIDKVFEALSSPPRRQILADLSRADMTAGQVVETLADSMSAPSVSKHLSILENAGLVRRERRGQNVHYGLKRDALANTLLEFLSAFEPAAKPGGADSALERIRRNMLSGRGL